jgi:transposase
MKLRRSRLTSRQTRRLLEHFVAGTPARTSAELVGVNRNTATYFYHRLREVIAAHLESVSPLRLDSAHELSGGGATRVTASVAAHKVTVLGVLQRGGKVYTAMLADAQCATVLPMLRARLQAESIVHTETLDVCDLPDFLGDPRRRARRGESPGHIRGRMGNVENFWSQAKRNLRRYNGVPMQHFDLFLKECEWRFNYGSPAQLLKTLDSWIKENV